MLKASTEERIASGMYKRVEESCSIPWHDKVRYVKTGQCVQCLAEAMAKTYIKTKMRKEHYELLLKEIKDVKNREV